MSSFRRLIWLIIIASGWFYSSKVIVVNYQKFLQYPYENKPTTAQDEYSNLEFPKGETILLEGPLDPDQFDFSKIFQKFFKTFLWPFSKIGLFQK